MRSRKRRPRGEGTLYYDETRARWVGAVTIAGRRRKVTARTKTDASARLAQLLASKTTGTPAPNRAITVAQAVATFAGVELHERHGRGGRPLAPSTLEGYRARLDTIAAELGDVRLANLTVEDVEAMLQRLATRQPRPVSVATLRKVRGTLQRVLAATVRRHHIGDNVALAARLPRAALEAAADAPSRRALSPDAARRLLDALRPEPAGLMFALSLRLGLRPGEAAALTWADVDSDVLHVRRGLRLIRGHPVIVDDLKTTGSERSIELPADVAVWIDEHRRATFGDVIPLRVDGMLMFPTSTGRPWSPSNGRRLLAAICERAGVPIVRPNELRHSCASLLSDMGVPNERIADLLGHTTTRMVEQTYRHRLRPVVDVAARADWLTETR